LDARFEKSSRPCRTDFVAEICLAGRGVGLFAYLNTDSASSAFVADAKLQLICISRNQTYQFAAMKTVTAVTRPPVRPYHARQLVRLGADRNFHFGRSPRAESCPSRPTFGGQDSALLRRHRMGTKRWI